MPLTLQSLVTPGQAAKAILDKVNPVESTPWWRANVKNNQNWRDYMNKLEGKTEGELQLYQFTMQSTNMLIKTLSTQST